MPPALGDSAPHWHAMSLLTIPVANHFPLNLGLVIVIEIMLLIIALHSIILLIRLKVPHRLLTRTVSHLYLRTDVIVRIRPLIGPCSIELLRRGVSSHWYRWDKVNGLRRRSSWKFSMKAPNWWRQISSSKWELSGRIDSKTNMKIKHKFLRGSTVNSTYVHESLLLLENHAELSCLRKFINSILQCSMYKFLPQGFESLYKWPAYAIYRHAITLDIHIHVEFHSYYNSK